ncbi:hypothetical protein PENSPDRAFT_662504 [Peniophora sp. CONT]|nr:hypothetical protein PENSPDRAFT_662504 [Peniophora sp. CONT]
MSANALPSDPTEELRELRQQVDRLKRDNESLRERLRCEELNHRIALETRDEASHETVQQTVPAAVDARVQETMPELVDARVQEIMPGLVNARVQELVPVLVDAEVQKLMPELVKIATAEAQEVTIAEVQDAQRMAVEEREKRERVEERPRGFEQFKDLFRDKNTRRT